jgi:hypothetical protein
MTFAGMVITFARMAVNKSGARQNFEGKKILKFGIFPLLQDIMRPGRTRRRCLQNRRFSRTVIQMKDKLQLYGMTVPAIWVSCWVYNGICLVLIWKTWLRSLRFISLIGSWGSGLACSLKCILSVFVLVHWLSHSVLYLLFMICLLVFRVVFVEIWVIAAPALDSVSALSLPGIPICQGINWKVMSMM